MKVLLVEDEEFIRDLFKRQLDLSGFATDAFSNGQDGLAAISKNAYDLVLLDIMLPDINGLQILQNIRQNPATKGVAVVLLTNLGQDAVIKQGFELGADGYLVKAAYTPDQIVQEVKNIMQKRQSQKPPEAAATPPPPGMPADPTITPPPTAATPPAPEAPVAAPTPPASPSPEPQMPAFPGQAPAAAPDPMINSAPAAMPPAPEAAAPESPAIPDPLAPAAAPATSPALSASDITSAASSTEETPPPVPTTEIAK